MKSSLICLLLLTSTVASAGIGGGFVDPTILSCSPSPVKEGVATLSVYHTEQKTVKAVYSNHVNDFNVSFEPVKVIEKNQEDVVLSIQNNMIALDTLTGQIKLTLNPVDIVMSGSLFGTIRSEILINGKVMKDDQCSYNLPNLSKALKQHDY